MAWTVAILDKYSVGPKRLHVLSCTADAAESNVDTGLDVVDHFSISVQSISTAGDAIAAYKNVDSSGTASLGKIGFSAATSGDVFYVYAYGR